MKKTVFFLFLFFAGLNSCMNQRGNQSIDRHALVTRNNVTVEGFDPLSSLSVGNGNFAFTTDLTGLQTFFSEYDRGVPLGTMSNWGWHSEPDSENYQPEETWSIYDVKGRPVPYRDQPQQPQRARDAANYLRANPHRLHLGMIGLRLIKENGAEAEISDIKQAVHHLDLWTGAITSQFNFEGREVKVEVYCHQDKDIISASVESSLIGEGRLGIRWQFPYARAEHTGGGYDFDSPEKHHSVITYQDKNCMWIDRKLDDSRYRVAVFWEGTAVYENKKTHVFELNSQGDSDVLEFSCLFTPEQEEPEIYGFSETKNNSLIRWPEFWNSGGAVDFSECTDPRAGELERRVVLSQYLTKIQSSGILPPAETGLTYNSWFGKFHLEMHWWHGAHFVSWQRSGYLLEQLGFYRGIYSVAQKTASEQGYKGVRWPKMVGPEGQNSPSSVGSYLIWQQPHIIWFAEQLYRQNPSDELLNDFKELVFATAEFMADFPEKDESGQYQLPPPLIPAQEHWDRETTYNPPFELAYWHWGLSTAQLWRERLNLDPEPLWDEVRFNLVLPDTVSGVYTGIQGASDSYTNPEKMRDHPMVLGAYGLLPDWDKINPDVMRKTMHTIAERWNWQSTWGWDYPMAAMTAVRLREPETALEFLLMDVQKNTYLKNGHNYQDERLRIYLPGNGGLLTTIAMMCAGYEGCKTKNPGFPQDGKWDVKWENLNPVF